MLRRKTGRSWVVKRFGVDLKGLKLVLQDLKVAQQAIDAAQVKITKYGGTKLVSEVKVAVAPLYTASESIEEVVDTIEEAISVLS